MQIFLSKLGYVAPIEDPVPLCRRLAVALGLPATCEAAMNTPGFCIESPDGRTVLRTIMPQGSKGEWGPSCPTP